MTVDIVMPVHNGEALLGECLEHLLREVDRGSIIVVDDASTDGTVGVAERLGVRVLREPVTVGPYAARNTGWRTSTADIVVFTDVRCRPLKGWFQGLLECLNGEGVAIVGCDIEMRANRPSTAERWALITKPLRIQGYLEHPFMPYVPTACLAITREHLVRLNGFSAVRSGADADFCWRAQIAGLGAITASEIGMWARPRTSSRGVLRQFRRYGQSGRELQRLYTTHGHVPNTPKALGTGRRALLALRDRRADPAVALLDAARIVAYEHGFRAEVRREKTALGKHSRVAG
ncbi:glycosyltransferase [Aeromicrobium sp.]|uniref:glycosyltransferase n=1 Tax=Aeromicrobium sp. TaxID=1871063 RepID=UPI0019C93734|nr:glycosyltransferase [Aeromicrobium sp.]MBC7630440.1 glycosyltransferase [Aeromicrobium sp.]